MVLNAYAGVSSSPDSLSELESVLAVAKFIGSSLCMLISVDGAGTGSGSPSLVLLKRELPFPKA